MEYSKKYFIVLSLVLGGCQTPQTSPLPPPSNQLGELLGERTGSHRINGQLVCYYDVINPKSGRTFSATPPPELKRCPDHVTQNLYTRHVEWGPIDP